MPTDGNAFGFSPAIPSSVAQTKMPEFPADFRCRHWATSSKFVNVFLERITPTGCPVQCATPSFQVQVSGLQLTLVKSGSPRAFQPGAVPSTNALGGAAGSSTPPVTTETANNKHDPTVPPMAPARMRSPL